MLDEEVTLISFNSPAVYAQEAQRVFEREAKRAAQEIVNIALKGATDKVRLDAAKYICDRTLGRIKDADRNPNENDPFKELFGTVTREPTAAERQAGMRPYRDES